MRTTKTDTKPVNYITMRIVKFYQYHVQFEGTKYRLNGICKSLTYSLLLICNPHFNQ